MSPSGFRDARLLDAAGVAKGKPVARRTPGLGATFDARHLIEARLLEILRRPQRPRPAPADRQYGAIARQLIQPRSQICLWYVDRPGHVPMSVLYRLAHVQNDCIRR